MNKLVVFSVVAFVAVTTRAAATYSYDDAERLNYVVTVPVDETAEISSEAIALLNADSVTNFVKRGDGTLLVGSVLDSYHGSVRIEDGIYRMVPTKTDNTACGARSNGGAIVVVEGATLSLRTATANTTLEGKKIFFGGRGHGNLGALHFDSGITADQEGAGTFGCNFELTSDALVRNDYAGWSKFSKYWKYMDMNGHALTFANSGNTARQLIVGCAGDSSGYDIIDPGPIYGIEGGINFYNYWYNLSGNADTLTISNNAALCFNTTVAQAKRTLIMAPGSRFQLNNGIAENSWYNNFAGPVRLEGTGLTPIYSVNKNYPMYLDGAIQCGGLRICQPMSLHLRVRWSENLLDKGVVVDNGGTVNVWYKPSLNEACGPLVVTNGCVRFRSGSENESTAKNVLSLPTAVFHGNSTVTNAYGWWKGSLTKTGAGDLVYESWIGAPELILKGGRFLMPTMSYPPDAQSTLQNVPELPVFTNLTATAGTELVCQAKNYSVKNLSGVTKLTECPVFTVNGQWTISADDALAGKKLETSGSFAFGASASVAVAAPAVPVKGTQTYTVLTAEGGVTGFTPGMVDEDWQTSLSADGKSVLLTHVGKGLILLFR